MRATENDAVLPLLITDQHGEWWLLSSAIHKHVQNNFRRCIVFEKHFEKYPFSGRFEPDFLAV